MVVVLAVLTGAALPATRAEAQGFNGQVKYTGALGPVGPQRPLCLCVYVDPGLTAGLGCLIFRTNAANYQVDHLNGDRYYLVAFLDLHDNERLDADEPYEIYLNRASPPADPVSAAANPTGIDFVFGDENLPAAPTRTPTPTSSVTPTAAPTDAAPTPSPTLPAEPADCDGNGSVGVDELIRAVAIALEASDLSTCPAADPNGDGAVRIDELVAALNVALEGPSVAPGSDHAAGGAHGS